MIFFPPHLFFLSDCSFCDFISWHLFTSGNIRLGWQKRKAGVSEHSAKRKRVWVTFWSQGSNQPQQQTFFFFFFPPTLHPSLWPCPNSGALSPGAAVRWWRGGGLWTPGLRGGGEAALRDICCCRSHSSPAAPNFWWWMPTPGGEHSSEITRALLFVFLILVWP